jgi:hypothetical protein
MARWRGRVSTVKVRGGSTIALTSTAARVRRGESGMSEGEREQGNATNSCAHPSLTTRAIAGVWLPCDGCGLWPVDHNVVWIGRLRPNSHG